MKSIYLECEPAELDGLIGELYGRGTLGLLELGSGLRAWFDDGVEIGDLLERYGGELISEEEQDWAELSKAAFPPLAIGERFWLVPPWNSQPAPTGRVRLEINPGLACGTGWHPCTQLCLEALERHVRPGCAVLDVGTGTGILSAASQLLGALDVVACDTDLLSVIIARDRVGNSVFAGSADALRGSSFDVVVANISRPIIEALLDELTRVCRPGAAMILSGFQTAPGLPNVVETAEREGWQCLVCARG